MTKLGSTAEMIAELAEKVKLAKQTNAIVLEEFVPLAPKAPHGMWQFVLRGWETHEVQET